MSPPTVSDAPLFAVEVETPFGPFTAFVTPEDGAVRLSGIGPVIALARSLPPGLVGRGWEEREVPSVSAAIRAWLSGERDAHARVPVSQVGGAFMQRVWLAMRGIPAGEVVTYGELAVLAGNPRAARAAGHACARNVVGLFVPCHRVVSATGLGSYGLGGNDLKRQLLEFEGIDVDRLGGG
ncbi:MAG: methylated-DNA--[protein]-cysteine S-methyltransferase [Demequinaceae bacterium]|nr:methylated-DNA--[protein]-cysteine S-methyltransferase [Demequinaceae bacterium]